MIETGILFGNIHSFNDLNLILSSAEIPPAKPKQNFVDIPGADGSVDMTEALGEVKYSDRTGAKFTFYMNPAGDLLESAWEAKKKEVSNLLNGWRGNISLDKDPGYYWQGRCTVDEHKSSKRLRKIVVGARLAPYKLKTDVTRVFVPLCTTNLFDNSNLERITGSRASVSTINTGVRATWEGGKSSYVLVKLLPLEMLIGQKITFSCSITESGGAKGLMMMGYSSADGTTRKSVTRVEGTGAASFTVEKPDPKYEYLAIWFYANNGTDPANVSEGAYVDYTNVVIELGDTVAQRRNLFTYPFSETTKTFNGITYTDNGDGTITVDGTATAQSFFVISRNKYPVGTYALSGCPAGGRSGTYHITANGFADIQKDIGEGGLIKVEDDSPQTNFVIVVQSGATVDHLVFKPQLEKGETVTEYAPIVPFSPYNTDAPDAEITLINARKTVCPSIIVTDEATVTISGGEFVLGEGTHKVLDLQLHEGETPVTVSGTGAVAFVYQERDL